MKVDPETLREFGVRCSMSAGTQKSKAALISSPLVDTGHTSVYF